MAKEFKMLNAGSIGMDVNTEAVLRDKDGNIKPIWQDNRLCMYLIKSSRLSPLWINQWYAILLMPFLGYWSGSKKYANLITNAGFAAIASRLNGSGSEAVFASIGQGIGTTAASAANTALETERTAAGGASTVHAVAAATASRVTTTQTNDTAQWLGTISETATLAITESGVFNATTDGVLLCRQVFTAINVVTGDSLQLTWKVKAS